MPLPDEARHAAVTRSWGRDVRQDLQEHSVNRASICFVKFDGIVFVLTNAAKLYCPAEYFAQALTQSLTSGRKELLAGITPFSP
jgi:hypothetical protein